MKNKVVIILSIFFLVLNQVYAKEEVEFSKCVDGDTIKVLLNRKEYTVRLLAVDTPESVHPQKKVEYYGKEASEYTCKKITNATKIELEYDDNSDKMDKYDRLLAWVYIDDILLQESLVENGYAKVAYLYGDYKYTKHLEQIQELVSAKNIGIWDTEAATIFNKQNHKDTPNYNTKDIIIIILLLLIIIFVSNKSIKNKATKSLKKYLK